jgi:D-beta-D-heptose 7-phosphate kinase / D-beta-D-heptose 1-phosphate adenosyltransferase
VSRRALAVVGDALLDRDIDGRAERLCPEAPVPVVSGPRSRERPGGAALAAALLARDGHEVAFVTALAGDEGGALLCRLLAERGVEVLDLGGGGATPEKIRVRADGQVVVRVDREGTPPAVRPPGDAAVAALRRADGVLVSDYGRGVAASPPLRALLEALDGPLVWDPHPRGAAPVRGVHLVTPNAAEARGMAGAGDAAGQAERIRAATAARAVAVSLGAQGAVLAGDDGEIVRVPARAVAGGDTCGAGDRLAATATAALADGVPPAEALRAAVRAASALVASGGAAAALADAAAPAHDATGVGAVRAAGGRIVATGGCFDLLHAGHIAMLEAARALGDFLVVLLNSDASVRRLKGADRPLVEQSDRAAVLAALRCVDAVVVFDEDTPERALAELAPDVWAKGADYEADELPEAATVREGGGEVVVLPYVAGRSTTRLIEEVLVRAER